MAKTHKLVKKDGTPKTRPLVSASRRMGTALSEILLDLVSPIGRAREEGKECQSTEEMVSKIGEANTRMEEKQVKRCMVGSMDVEGFNEQIPNINYNS